VADSASNKDVLTIDAVADRGYYDSEEIRACEESGITVTVNRHGIRTPSLG
jgi:hypothetical protein